MISVVVPIYNTSKYLRKGIESIINQKYEDLEIILIDDGSTDDSGRICDYYRSKDPRITVIHQKNGGLVKARKAGLKIAKGEYIGFVDGDDYISVEMYSTLLDLLQSNDVDFVTGPIQIDEGGKLSEYNPIKKELRYEFLTKENIEDFIKEYIFFNNEDIHIYAGLFPRLYKSELIKKCYQRVPDELPYAEDFLCTIYLLTEAKNVYVTNKFLYYQNVNPDSMSRTITFNKFCVMSEMYEMVNDFFIKLNMSEELTKGLICRYLDYFKVVLNSFNKEMEPIRDFYLSKNIIEDLKKTDRVKIVLYGAGEVGRDIYLQLCPYSKIDIVCWIDRDFDRITNDYMKISSINDLEKCDYDKILITVWRESMANDIIDMLRNRGISADKIVWYKPLRINRL